MRIGYVLAWLVTLLALDLILGFIAWAMWN